MADADVKDFLNKLSNESTEVDMETKDDSTVEVDSIEVSGVIKDKSGRVWRVPDSNVEDLSDLGATPGLAKIKKDPRFDYQLINVNDIDEYLTNDWALVTRQEAGLPEIQLQKEGYSLPLAGYVHIMDSIYVKKPKALVKRDRAILDYPAKLAMEDINPSEEMRKTMRDAEIPMQHKHIRTEDVISQQVLDDFVMKEE